MSPIQQLLGIMRALRHPEKGCPWDLGQNFNSLIPYTLEEAYEVADAIEQNNSDEIKNELGDLLFQIVFYSQLATEQHDFDFDDVVTAINEKLIRRHPHVFAGAKIKDAAEQTKEWDRIKREERKNKEDQNAVDLSCLDDVSRILPSLMRAEKLQKRAAREGFDWAEINDVIAKVYEELEEVKAEVDASIINQEKIEEEIGDLFFSCINLSRHAGVNAEQSLRNANLKFERRFRAIEKIVISKGLSVKEMKAGELEKLWIRVKNEEK